MASDHPRSRRHAAVVAASLSAALIATLGVTIGAGSAQPPRSAAPVRTGAVEATDEADMRLFAAIPGDVQAAVVIRHAAWQRTTPAGRALLAAYERAGLVRATRDAWNELAAAIGLSPAETFDALLGRRFAVGVRSLQDPLRSWVLITQVPQEYVPLIQQRLRPAPRAITGGHMILALEHGKYELSIVSRGQGEGSTLLIAPAEHAPIATGSLLDATLRRLTAAAGGARTGMAATHAAERLRELGTADIRVIIQQPARAAPARDLPPPADPDPPRYLIASAANTTTGWRADLEISRAAIWGGADAGNAQPDERITDWSPAAFSSIAQDALVAVAGLRERAGGGNEWLSSALAGVWGAAAPIMTVPSEPPGWPGAGRFIVALREPAADDGRWGDAPPWPGACPIVAAVESSDLAASADKMDAAMHRLQQAISPAEPISAPITTPRTMTLTPQLDDGSPAPGGTHIAWLFRPSLAPSGAGWTVVGMTPTGIDPSSALAAARSAADVLVAAPQAGADLRPYISLGLVRPGDVVERFGPSLNLPTAAAGLARGIDEVRWSAWIGKGDVVRGQVELRTRLAPPEATPVRAGTNNNASIW